MMYEVKRQQLPNGEVMAYREENTAVDAPVLLLIHGNQSSSLYYEHLMQQFRKEAHIYAIDMMGFGDSSYKNPHTCMKDWADDVAQFMDAQKIRKAVALGWSAGGVLSRKGTASGATGICRCSGIPPSPAECRPDPGARRVSCKA